MLNFAPRLEPTIGRRVTVLTIQNLQYIPIWNFGSLNHPLGPFLFNCPGFKISEFAQIKILAYWCRWSCEKDYLRYSTFYHSCLNPFEKDVSLYLMIIISKLPFTLGCIVPGSIKINKSKMWNERRNGWSCIRARISLQL